MRGLGYAALLPFDRELRRATDGPDADFGDPRFAPILCAEPSNHVGFPVKKSVAGRMFGVCPLMAM
jgi:hypothetical protein